MLGFENWPEFILLPAHNNGEKEKGYNNKIVLTKGKGTKLSQPVVNPSYRGLIILLIGYRRQ